MQGKQNRNSRAKIVQLLKKGREKCVAKREEWESGGGRMESGRAMESGRVSCQLTVAPCAVVASS